MIGRRLGSGIAAGLLAALVVVPAAAQAPGSGATVPEKVEPNATGTLSEKLNRTDGVITPPSTATIGTVIRPSDTGTTPVITPPGEPGGNQQVQPK